MANSKHGHITYCLQDIFTYRAWKLLFVLTVLWL